MKKLLLLLLPVALVAAVVVVGLRLSDGGRGERPRADGPAVGDAPVEPPAVLPADVEPVEDEPERRAIPERGAVATTETFALDGARWLVGHLTRPAQHPPEPALEVVALSVRPDDPEDWARTVAQGGAGALVAPYEPFDVEPAWARRPVEPDGSFRVPVHPDADRALVVLRADWLYLESPTPVGVDGEVVRLEAKLGGRVRLRWIPPAGTDAQRVAELAGAPCEFGGWGGTTSVVRRRLAVPETLELVADAVPPELQLFHGVETEAFVPPIGFGFQARAGEWVERDVELQLGAEVSGRVDAAAGGAPLGEALVRAHTEGRRGFLGAQSRTRSTETGPDGTFRLRGIAPGEVVVDATHADHLPETLELGELEDGEVRAGLVVALADGATVAGAVRLPDGEPAGGATVRLRDVGPGDPERTALADSRKVEADGEGRFAVRGLGSGPFALKAEWSAAEDAPAFKAWVEDVPAGRTDLVVALAPTIALPGRVVDDRGEPVTAFRVTARRLEVAIEDRESELFADADGEFRLRGLVPGRWSVAAYADGYTGSEEVELDVPPAEPFVIALVRAGTVRGLVLDPDGEPAADARVTLAMAGNEREGADADEDGRFEVTDVRPGRVAVSAVSPSWAPSEEIELEVGAGEEPPEVTLHLTRGGTLTGEVWEEDGGPAAGRMVVVNGDGARSMASGNLQTDADGRFVREHLAPGTYQVFALPGMEELAASARDGGPDMGAMLSKLETATATVEEGQVTHVVLGAPPEHPVTVRGRVTAAGEPRRRAFLAVVGEDRALFDALQMEQTDDDGGYEVVVDAPGNYTFVVSEDLGSSEGVEFNVTIPDVAEHRLDLALPLGVLRGLVTDAAGAGIEGAVVSWTRDGDMTSLGSMTGARRAGTDADGAFELTALRPGRYTLRAGPSRWSEGAEHGHVVSDPIVLEEDRAVEGVRLVLPRAGRLKGIVRDTAGEPVRGAVVHVRDESGRVVQPQARSRTDAGGGFELDGVAPGAVSVSARDFDTGLVSPEVGPVQVLEDEVVEVAIVVDTGTWILVSVEDEDGDLVRASIEVTDSDGNGYAGLFPADFGRTATERLSSTEHRVGPLVPGRYRVTATTADGRTTSRPVTVRPGPEKKVRLKL